MRIWLRQIPHIKTVSTQKKLEMAFLQSTKCWHEIEIVKKCILSKSVPNMRSNSLNLGGFFSFNRSYIVNITSYGTETKPQPIGTAIKRAKRNRRNIFIKILESFFFSFLLFCWLRLLNRFADGWSMNEKIKYEKINFNDHIRHVTQVKNFCVHDNSIKDKHIHINRKFGTVPKCELIDRNSKWKIHTWSFTGYSIIRLNYANFCWNWCFFFFLFSCIDLVKDAKMPMSMSNSMNWIEAQKSHNNYINHHENRYVYIFSKFSQRLRTSHRNSHWNISYSMQIIMCLFMKWKMAHSEMRENKCFKWKTTKMPAKQVNKW